MTGTRIPCTIVAFALSLLAVGALTGCPAPGPDEVSLLARTAPPPAKTARVTHDREFEEFTVVLSDGVAMSVGCWDNCDYTCESPTFSSADPSVLEVRPITRLTGSTEDHLIFGAAPGSTTLTVSSQCGSQTYQVTVLDD